MLNYYYFSMSCRKLHIENSISDLNQALTSCFIDHGVSPVIISKVRVLVLELQNEERD